MVKPREVVDWFVWRAAQDEDAITHLKAQKLAYYAQGFHLALHDRPLMNVNFKAWGHGPVIGELYHELKGFGSASLPLPTGDVHAPFGEDEYELLGDVWGSYGRYSAWMLRDLTHTEPPWMNARAAGLERISEDDMRMYFKTQLV